MMSVENKARLAFAAALLVAALGALGWALWRSERNTTYQLFTGDAVSGLLAEAPS